MEYGYFLATAVLCVLLWALYRRGPAERAPQRAPTADAIRA